MSLPRAWGASLSSKTNSTSGFRARLIPYPKLRQPACNTRVRRIMRRDLAACIRMDRGLIAEDMDMAGGRSEQDTAGRRLQMGSGFPIRLLVGRGSAFSLGAGRHITMGAGCLTPAAE